MFRTTPPPEGIAHRLNARLIGSKRTTVFGLPPDSLYQNRSVRSHGHAVRLRFLAARVIASLQ